MELNSGNEIKKANMLIQKHVQAMLLGICIYAQTCSEAQPHHTYTLRSGKINPLVVLATLKQGRSICSKTCRQSGGSSWRLAETLRSTVHAALSCAAW